MGSDLHITAKLTFLNPAVFVEREADFEMVSDGKCIRCPRCKEPLVFTFRPPRQGEKEMRVELHRCNCGWLLDDIRGGDR